MEQHPRKPWPHEVPHFFEPCEAVLVDFGGASKPGEAKKGRVGARQIRAPEVVLGLDWDTSADLWSLGCVLANLYRGNRLFQVHDDMEHLAAIEQVTDSKIPVEMASKVSSRIMAKGVHFDEHGRLLWPEYALNHEAIERVASLAPLQKQVVPRHIEFLDLLKGLLRVNPCLRLSADEALKKPFVLSSDIME